MKPRVLVIDDDESVTQRLFWTLSDDYDVVIANDLPTAVRRATVYRPTISILDLNFPPEVNSTSVGLRILEYLKSHVPHSKVLVVSSSSGTETRKACYAVGADEFLSKPFEIEQLLTTIRRLAPTVFDFA